MNRTLRRVLRAGAWAGAALVLALAVFVGGFRVIEPWVPGYRDAVAAWAGDALGAPVDIEALDLRWRGLRPELVLERVRFVSADARRAMAVREVRVGLGLRSLALHGRLAPARIVLVEPDVTLILEPSADGSDARDRWQRTFAARERRGEVLFVGGRLTLLSEAGRTRVELDAVEGRVSSDGLNHTVRARAQPGGGVAGAVSFNADARGWPGEPDWRATAHGEFNDVDLVALQRMSRGGRLTRGELDLKFELIVARGRVHRARAELGLTDLRWQTSAGADRSALRAAADFTWQRQEGGWLSTLGRMTVADAGGTHESGSLTLGYTEGEGDAWRVTADRFALEHLALLVDAAPLEADPRLLVWAGRAPRGLVERAEFSLVRAPESVPSYAFTVTARGLGLDAAGDSVPGFDGVALDANGDHARGHAVVSVADGHVHFPRAFRGPFALDRAEVVVDWSQEAGRWTIALPVISAANADVAATGRGGLVVTADARPQLNLVANFRDAVFAAHRPYLPVTIMSDTLVAWLDRSVRGGRAPHGEFRYDGPVGGGALSTGDATLLVDFAAEDIALDFADGWPLYTGGGGRLRFAGTRFDAQLDRGALGGTPITTAAVTIADFSTAALAIDARAGGAFDTMLATFLQTPLGKARWIAGATGDGAAVLDIDIALPLQTGAYAEVDGAVTLAGATLTLDGFPHPLTDIHGVVAVSEDGADATDIRASLFDRPVAVEVRTLRDGERTARAVEVQLDGELDADGIAQLAGTPLPSLAGRTHWTARVLAPYEASAPVVEVESDLHGLAIDLPAPIGKVATVRREVLVRAQVDADRRRLSLDAGDAVQAVLMFGRDAERAWTLERGRLHLGPGEPAPLPDRDLAVSGAVEVWRHDAATRTPTALPVTGAVSVGEVDVEIGDLEALGRSFGRVRIEGRRSGQGWRWSFDGPQVAGRLDLPDAPTNTEPVRAEFERLVVEPARAAAPGPLIPADMAAGAVPPLVFHARHLRVGAIDLGEVNGSLLRVENGVALEGFTATRIDARITADATWHTVDGFHRTVLRATVDSTDVQATLGALGYAASMDAAAGHLQADLDWLGSPLSDPRALLNGALEVRVERGNLHEVQAGAGRVFGLLSVYALPRRLALDFSDVFRRGLAFDSITGSFRIEEGQAYSDDLTLIGPAVRVEVAGRTGLATRDYDQVASVTASLASSLTLAGALVGGPGVGAALLIASELFKGPLDDIARVRYRMTGPWDDPVFERLEEPR